MDTGAPDEITDTTSDQATDAPAEATRLDLDAIERDVRWLGRLGWGWGLPLVLCARTTLGTINHTLLSIEAIRARGIPLLGVAFLGEPNTDSEAIIADLGRTRRLGRLARLAPLDSASLKAAFADAFDVRDFLGDAP